MGLELNTLSTIRSAIAAVNWDATCKEHLFSKLRAPTFSSPSENEDEDEDDDEEDPEAVGEASEG